MKNRFLKELPLETRAPRCWGMAWYDPQKRVKVCAPMPFHLLAWLAREFRWRLEVAWHAPQRERQERNDMQRRIRESQALAQEYARGYLAGWRECREACLEVAEMGGLMTAAEAQFTEEIFGDGNCLHGDYTAAR